MSSSKLSYRPEIDGLRAIAVVSVILYHAQMILFGRDWFEGGFIGVDIFFVISGYLITKIILFELQTKGSFNFINFYERRARRILPMLFLTLFATFVLGWIFLNTEHHVELVRSAEYAILFVANFFFLNELAQYGTSSSLLKPLLHTWSLGVEEQFYLFFPIIFVLAGRVRLIFFILIGISVASLIYANNLVLGNEIKMFYSPFSRIWEILIGALTAFIFYKYEINIKKIVIKDTLAIFGLLLILYSFYLFSKKVPHPSFFTLIPVLGAALMLAFSSSSNLVGKMLSLEPMVFIGRISYSLYLWHFPFFAIFRYENGDPDFVSSIIIIAIVFILSYFSYRFVEVPFRNQKMVTKRGFLLSIILVALTFFAFTDFVKINDGLKYRPFSYGSMSPNLTYASLEDYQNHNGLICSQKRYSEEYDESIIGCEYGDLTSDRLLITIGDSHLGAITRSLSEYAIKNSLRVIDLDIKGCAYFITNVKHTEVSKDLVSYVDQCVDRFAELKRLISDLDAEVLLIYRWMYHLFPIDDFDLDMPTKNEAGVVEDESYREHAVLLDNGILSRSREDKLLMLDSFVSGLANSSKHLYFVKTVPEISYNIEKENRDFWIKSGWSTILEELSISSEEYKRRNLFIDLFLEKISSSKVSIVDTEKVFCNSFRVGRCVAQFDGIPFYYDDDHLSKDGADLLVEELERLKIKRKVESFQPSLH